MQGTVLLFSPLNQITKKNLLSDSESQSKEEQPQPGPPSAPCPQSDFQGGSEDGALQSSFHGYRQKFAGTAGVLIPSGKGGMGQSHQAVQDNRNTTGFGIQKMWS